VSSRCWIYRNALTELLAEARRWPRRETGGALLGWRDGDRTVVARILGPGPHARHERHAFEPDAEWQNAEGARIYEDSGRMIAYLGDWHTHPRGSLVPSRQDAQTAEAIAQDGGFRTATPLYAIAGRRFRPRAAWRLNLYEWRAGRFATVVVEMIDPEGSPRSG